MHWLGRIYGGLEDYPPDHGRAVTWLKKAAEEGDDESQCNLGISFIRGLGVGVDDKAGAYWYRKAAERGNAWASYLLGLCYRDGTGVKQNKRSARRWFEKASRGGVREAKKALKGMATSKRK